MKLAIRIVAIPALCVVLLADKGDNENCQAILPQLATSMERIVSTVPANGDVNPYGVAFVPNGFPKSGSPEPGDILVYNGEGHVAMYVGGGFVIDAPQTGMNVEKIPESTSWYADNIDGVLRP